MGSPDRREGARALAPDELAWRCDASEIGFETTAGVEGPTVPPGQERAVEALATGLAIERDGFNLFVFGAPGTGRHRLVAESLARRAARRPAPPDLCYVHDFRDEHRPRLVELPAGKGSELARDLDELVRDLATVLPAAFESEEFQSRKKGLDEEIEGRQREAWERIAEDARGRGLSVLQSPVGLMFAPLAGEKVLSPEDFQKLPAAERARLEGEVERLKGEVEKIMLRLPGWMRERRRRQEELERDTARRSLAPLFAEKRAAYAEWTPVVEHLAAVEDDAVARARPLARLLSGEGEEGPQEEGPGSPLRRYRVNVLVGHAGETGAPVVIEPHPTLANLVGRVEQYARQGALFTDFTMVKAGALHRASGGYLVLDAAQLLRQPLAWDALKRALRNKRVRIESAAEALSLSSTVTLEPVPAPLDVKIVLVGEPYLYYLLSTLDSDFPELFKIGVDFATRLERTPESVHSYARLVAGLAAREQLRALDAGAVARLLEHGARLAGDADSFTLELGALLDVMQEADHLAAEAPRISRAEVEAAIAARDRRADRLREELERETQRGTIRVATEGSAVGQVNGLAVAALDRFRFGHPVRLSARARLGEGTVVDVEREVELGGPLHSKGVLILQGFLGQRYAPGLPLSLHATLVFEQSYGPVEGDSASMAELCALLSAVGELPLDQGIAITGSVDQHGNAQAIGGVNEKIEGFFRLCRARGLTGSQGVLIPESNVPHLMLDRSVIEAVEAGRFHVWAVATVDEAMARLTGRPAGERGEDGIFPDESVNSAVETRLVALALQRVAFQKGKLGEEGDERGEPEAPASGEGGAGEASRRGDEEGGGNGEAPK